MSSIQYLQNGRYAILKKLGEGGKGIVYKARDTALNRVVAVKMLKIAVTEEEAYSRFMTEAQAVAKLNHPNIVSIYDIGKENGKHFFVLEFIDGESLRDFVEAHQEDRCATQAILRIGADICSALQCAHTQNVLHRDVKPENVMITKEGFAKLMDFGLARMIGQPRVTQDGVIVGTVAYVAPEIALGKIADARSDLYSFGAVLYEAISGRPPFLGDDPIKVIFGHIHDHPVSLSKLNPKVPQALSDCVMKLLEKEPESRFQSAEDLLKALKQISENFFRETPAISDSADMFVPSLLSTAGREIQLIDRAEEMSILREAVDRTVRGEGGLVFLRGEAGIGKTRLTRELRAYARLRGLQVLHGRCSALFKMNGFPPYVLWSEVIRDYLKTCTSEQLCKVVGLYPAEIAKIVPELGQRLGKSLMSLPINPKYALDRLFEAVSQFIANISSEAPLLLILDDLQWTDRTSLLLLHYVARGIYDMPLLLLCAYRDDEVEEEDPLSRVLAELNRERLLQSVSLKRLPSNDVSEMVRRILQDEASKEFCELVYQKTRGNPFFVEEVVKSLKEEEIIFRDEDRWKIRKITKIELPKTVKSIMRARIGRLDHECRDVLTMASFVGSHFTFDAICEVTGKEKDKLLELMERLLSAGLLEEKEIREETVYCFADVVVREVVHEDVSHQRHKKLHSAVGNALEKAYSKKIEEHLGELAYHFLECGDEKKALDYFLKAGERASRVHANTEAASCFQSALALFEKKEGLLREKVSVLEKLGDLKRLAGEYDMCMKYWNDCLLLGKELGDTKLISRLHCKTANVLWENLGDVERAKEHHQSALQILETEPETVALANLYVDIASQSLMSGEAGAALASAQKALDLAKKMDSHEAIACSYITLGSIMNWTGEKRRGLGCLEKGLKIALDNDLFDLAVAAYNEVAAALPIEEEEKIMEYYEKGYDLAKRVGTVHKQSWIAANLATRYIGKGDMDKAILMAEESVALDRKAGDLVHLALSLGRLAHAFLLLGEWDKSEQHFNEAFRISCELKDLQSIVLSYRGLGSLCFEKGDFERAKEYYGKMYQEFEKAGAMYHPALMRAFRSIISTHLELGEMEMASSRIGILHDFAIKTNDHYLIAYERMLKGMLLRVQKKWEESIGELEAGRKQLEAIGANRWDTYTFAKAVLCECARAYIERDQQGDKEKAYNLLNQALEIFRKMGAKRDLEKIIAKKKLLTA